jgi:uncharacterized protein YyaL (SSP411 family)
MVSFPQVLQTLAEAYKDRKDELELAAAEVMSHLKQASAILRGTEPLHDGLLDTAYIVLKNVYDKKNGGFGVSPKFPQPIVLEFLLRYYHRNNDERALMMVEHTLEQMARGGIYDQLDGGFHRYSVDAQWLVPHFEKMLYDNAQLSRIYLHAYQVTGKRTYRLVVEQTIDYVLHEMRDDDGGFYSAQDADSEGVEGKYYVWTPEEVRQILGEQDGKLICRYFGINKQGNFEGKNVLAQSIAKENLAAELGLTTVALESSIDMARELLLKKRSERIPPQRDDKILANWNGLMLASIAEAALVLNRDDYLQAAISNGRFLMQTMREGSYLKHSGKDGYARGDAFLQDYSLVCDGLLSLYEATFDESWLQDAASLAETMIELFWEEEPGLFYDTGRAQESLILRPRNMFDNVLPSGASAAAFVLLRLGRLLGNDDYEELAAGAIYSVQTLMARYPLGFANWLSALDYYLSEPKEIAVVGRMAEMETRLLMNVVGRRYLPNKVLAVHDPDKPTQKLDIPLLLNRDMLDNKPTVYICEGNVCQTPVTEPEALAAMLEKP